MSADQQQPGLGVSDDEVVRAPELSRQQFLARTGAAAATLAIGGGLASALPSAARAAEAERVASKTLRVAIYGAPSELDGYKKLFAKWLKAHPGTEIKIEGTVYEQFAQKMNLAFASGHPADVVYTFTGNFPAWAPKGVFRPIDDLIARDSKEVRPSDYFPKFLGLLRYNGKTYGLPDNASTIVMFYRPSLFKAAGLTDPNTLAAQGKWTWTTFLSHAQKLTNGSGPLPQRTWGVDRPWPTYSIIASLGGSILSKDNKRCLVNTPQTIAALEALTSWETSLNVSPPPSAVAGLGDAFTVKKVAMTIDGYWRRESLILANDLDYDVAPLPRGPGGQVTRIATNGFCISSKTKNRELAWEFIKFFQAPATRLRVAALGYSIPPQRSVAYGKHFLGKVPAHQRVFLDVAKTGRPDPLVPFYDEMSSLLSAALDEVYAGKKSVKDIAPGLQTDIAALI